MLEIQKVKLGDKITVWFSCGAASAVAAWLTVQKYGSIAEISIVNNSIKQEDSDNHLFLMDVSKWIDKHVTYAANPKYPDGDAEKVWADRKYMSGTKGAPCTTALKKEARYRYELLNKIDWHVMGFTADEKHRHQRFVTFEQNNLLPVLIDEGITKEMCYEIIESHGIVLPYSYRIGLPNANCLGCVKSTSPTYWNHIRIHFPEVFKARAVQSRELGARLVRYKGRRIFLDELPVDAKGQKMKSYECSIWCDKY